MHTFIHTLRATGLTVVILLLLGGRGTQAQPSIAPAMVPVLTPEPTPLPTQIATLPPVPMTAPPTIAPMAPPTVAPMAPPTVAPVTMAPTLTPLVPTLTPVAPSVAPVTNVPSIFPTQMPTMPPVATNVPTTGMVTMTPTVGMVTAAPSNSPSGTVLTAAPSPTPSVPLPSATPSSVPSGMPSAGPSMSPTRTATELPSSTPSSMPSGAETPSPSAEPTASPTASRANATFTGLSLVLTGMEPMSEAAILVWSRTTADHFLTTFEDNPGLGIADAATGYFFSSQQPPARRRKLRELQGSELTVIFDQSVSYRDEGSALSSEEVIQVPFGTTAQQDEYIAALKATGHPAFTNLVSVSSLQPPDDTGGSSGLSTGAIIGIAIGGAVGAALLAGGGYWAYNRNRSSGGGYSNENDDTPPAHLQLGGADEVSTMDAGTKGQESLAGYGDQSVATVDYDYSKAYGGGADTSVSSAGGTFGSQTQGTASDELNAAGAALGTSYDEGSYDAQYAGNTSVREEVVEVYAPAGKLGVVIDTPDDGAPVVHAIKDSSVISDKLQVGDKLVSVDDEDVRSMTAIKVSKLISRKSANFSRKLTVVRTSVAE